MKISELKGGDLIKIKPSHGHEQEYVKIVDFGPKNGILVYETHLSGGGQWWITRDDVIAKMESVPVEQEKIYTFTQGELFELCRSIEILTKDGSIFCRTYGYENAVQEAKRRGLI